MKKLPKSKRFFYHYNKPESKAQDCTVLTLHWEGKCHLVSGIECHVPTETHSRKQQPHCVVRGWAEHVEFNEFDGTATVFSGLAIEVG
jgi:hypothetical protein